MALWKSSTIWIKKTKKNWLQIFLSSIITKVAINFLKKKKKKKSAENCLGAVKVKYCINPQAPDGV